MGSVLLATIIVNDGCGRAAAANSDLALATSRAGIGSALTYHGLDGASHWLPGVNWPLNTTWLSASRSIDSSSASRTRLSWPSGVFARSLLLVLMRISA